MVLQFVVEIPRPINAEPKSNYISTTKYNIITFLPFALLLQFRRYANIYFLFCAILQSIPIISPLSPASAITPLVFVLTLSMVREGFQDYNRWKSDQSDNSQLTLSVRGDQLVKKKWKELLVGDFIKIEKDKLIPADVLVLVTSSRSGISYVQTSSLDGEKNLKPKFSLAPLQNIYNQNPILATFDCLRGKIECSKPSALIQAFEGMVSLNSDKISINERINKKNMILRGCKLKNTDWVAGIIIYTGLDTAIMMNSGKPRIKTSNIQKTVNKIILVVMAFEIFCCFGSAVYCYFGCVLISGSSVNCIITAVITFGSYFILYSTFIPISLIVSLQFVKVFQGYFMSTDKQMFCALNQRALQCHTVSINEELGQVQYILTDKTGTLTCNKMQFKNIVIGRQLYGSDLKIGPMIAQKINYERMSMRYKVDQSVLQQKFDSRTLTYDLAAIQEQSEQQASPKKQLIELIFIMIATCHQCVPSSKGGYEGPSPDQVALLRAAAEIGFKFVSNENKILTVEYHNKQRKFQLLKLIQFDSDRKRMTVVLKTQKGVSVFVKGADTSIEKLLTPNQKYLHDIRQKTEEMTKTGLRSLWYAYKTYPSNIDVFALKVQEIENGLTLIGATGIQDKLQDFVAQTIFSLRSGGIKFIMLTGDKLQTAENIALSCKLIEEGYLIKNVDDLQNFLKYIDNSENVEEAIIKSPVIDGSAISFVQSESSLLILISKVKSLVFCRVTPGQKAEIVKLVKKLGKLTLAIGDGANDVNMIMQAHVGVGIFGEQGTRAAQVANYAIGEFCLLWKLVLYYGRLNYMRVTEMILYFFYKNMVFTSVQFAFCFYNLASGQSFWLSWSITFYNMVFTFFPVVLRAVFEIDIELKPTKETFHALSQGTHQKQILYSYYPKMYNVSQKNKLFTHFIFFTWFFLGFAQGIICVILTLYSIGDENDTSGFDSFESGFYFVQISAYTSVIIVVTVKLAVNVKHWTVILFIGFLVPSLGLYVVFSFIISVFQDAVSYDSMMDLLKMPSFYVIQFLCIGGMFSFDFLLFSIQATKHNFVNYLKFRTLREQRLSQHNLKQFMLQMVSTEERKAQFG